MAYRLFYTDIDASKESYQADKPHLIPYIYAELDDALAKAREIANSGRVPWEIEGDDGTVIRRYDIPRLVRERAADLDKRRKLY